MRASRKRPFSKCLRAFALRDNQMSTFNTKQTSQKWTLEVLTSFSKRFRTQNSFPRVLIVTTKKIRFCAFRTLRSDAYTHFSRQQKGRNWARAYSEDARAGFFVENHWTSRYKSHFYTRKICADCIKLKLRARVSKTSIFKMFARICVARQSNIDFQYKTSFTKMDVRSPDELF